MRIVSSKQLELSDKQIVEIFEDNGYDLTNNPNHAIYVLRNGSMIDGVFVGNNRSEDHRCAECLFDDIDRYDENFWSELFRRTSMVLLMPETETALKGKNQKLTPQQTKILEKLNYEILDE